MREPVRARTSDSGHARSKPFPHAPVFRMTLVGTPKLPQTTLLLHHHHHYYYYYHYHYHYHCHCHCHCYYYYYFFFVFFFFYYFFVLFLCFSFYSYYRCNTSSSPRDLNNDSKNCILVVAYCLIISSSSSSLQSSVTRYQSPIFGLQPSIISLQSSVSSLGVFSHLASDQRPSDNVTSEASSICQVTSQVAK